MYNYKKSPIGRYTLMRDGSPVLTDATEQNIWAYLHAAHSSSVDHLLRHEGYKIVPDVAPQSTNEP